MSGGAVLSAIQVMGDAGVPATPTTAARAIALATGRFHQLSADADAPLPDGEFHELVAVAEHHRLLGALAEAVESGALALTDDQQAHLRARHRFWLVNVLKVERLLVQVVDCLAAEGVDLRVAKGVALAHTVYGDPSWRVFADLDLLVRPEQLDRAVQLVLDRLGGERPTAELRPGFDREFGKEAMLLLDEMELDLHRTLVSGPFGLTIGLDELFADPAEVVVGGRTVSTLGRVSRYLHACYNLALGDYPVRLGAVRDLLLVDAAGDVPVEVVVATARRWGGTAVVQRAGELMCEVLGDNASPVLRRLAGLEVPRRQRLVMRTYLTPARAYRRQLASLLVIEGVRPRLRYLRALVRPSADYLASRGWTATGHVRRAVRRLVRGSDV